MKLVTLWSPIISLILVFGTGSAYSQSDPSSGGHPAKVESQSEKPSQPTPAKQSSETGTPAPEKPKADSANTVPKLKMVWECADCTVNEKVIPLIEKNYAEEAVKKGKTVSETDIADVAIIDFRQRPPGVRVMFGFMAGKDRLALRVRYKGNEFKVDDSSVTAITGMNAICANVAEKLYTEFTR